MGYFDNMGLAEKIAFGIFSVVAAPVALVVTAYETLTEDKAKEISGVTSRQQSEEMARDHAKEKQAEQERTAIVDYARKALSGVIAAHTATEAPAIVAINFQDLRNVIKREGSPLEIFGRWMPQSQNTDESAIARKAVERLDLEIVDLKTLREAVHDLELEDI